MQPTCHNFTRGIPKTKPKASNDLPEAPRNCSTECYVEEDTKFFVSFHSHDTQRIVEEMNEDLLGVRNWCFRNRLLLNPDKMKLIVFGSQQMTSKLHEFRLSLMGKFISLVQSAKDLGVILDSNLTFDNIGMYRTPRAN